MSLSKCSIAKFSAYVNNFIDVNLWMFLCFQTFLIKKIPTAYTG